MKNFFIVIAFLLFAGPATLADETSVRVAISETYQSDLLKTMDRYLRLVSGKACLEPVRENHLKLELVSTNSFSGFRKLHTFQAHDDNGEKVGTLEIVTDKGPKKFTTIVSCRFQSLE